MEKVCIEEFPGVHPDVIRSAVETTAQAANSYAYQGAKVCGVSIRVEGNMLVGTACVILPGIKIEG